MARFYVVLIVLVVGSLIAVNALRIFSLLRGRGRGTPSEKGKITLFDVRYLIQKGEKEQAIRIYEKLFQTNRYEAQKAVEQLEKNIQDHNRNS